MTIEISQGTDRLEIRKGLTPNGREMSGFRKSGNFRYFTSK